jgi:serine protease Do
MRKIALILFVLLWIVCDVQAEDKIENIEHEIKIVLNKVSPSLVKVVAENARKYVATGIALESDLVITTSLITRHPFERISVETIKGETIAARIAGQDNRSGLTLLRIGKKGLSPLPQAMQAEVGNWVALIGLFYNRFPAITQGIISSRSESELILNAPVAPGAAGGAVVNRKGELLGIIRGSFGFSYTPDYTFKDHSAVIVVSGGKSESGNLCYAIPIDRVKRIAEKLKISGKIIPGWLGINFSGDSNLILEVIKDSPAAKAGMAKGDKIEEIGGKAIDSFLDIAAALKLREAGEKIKVTVLRSGKPLPLNVELGERQDYAPLPAPFPIDVPGPPEPPEDEFLLRSEHLEEIPELLDQGMTLPWTKNYVIEFGGARQLGVDVMEMTPELSKKFLVKEGYGLLISTIDPSSAAKKVGLLVGDIIVRANGSSIKNNANLRKVLLALKGKEPVLVELYRDGQLKKFSLIPDKNDKQMLKIRQFAEKMEDLKENISDETKLMIKDEIQRMRQSREKALLELQKQRELSLYQTREESRKLALELRKIEEEKNRLGPEARKKYAEELKKIQEELRRIQEKIQSEIEEKDG